MQTLQKLGWEWRDNGVILSVVVDGQKMQVFVPIRRVWLAFEEELSAVGCPGSGSCGCIGPRQLAVGYPAQLSVGGFFDFVKKAVRTVTAPVRSLVPSAIYKAASRVVDTARRYGGAALRTAGTVARSPVFRGIVIAASFAVPALAPAAAALELANRAAQYYAQAQQAAKAIQAGYKTAENVAAVVRGVAAKRALTGAIQLAKRGDPRAQQLVGAFRHHLVNAERRRPGGGQALAHARNVAAQRRAPQWSWAAQRTWA